MNHTIDIEQLKQKETAYESLSKELYATQTHVAPLLQGLLQFLDQSLASAQKCEDYKQACTILVESTSQVRAACLKHLQEYKSSGDMCKGKSEAYREIIDGASQTSDADKEPDQTEEP